LMHGSDEGRRFGEVGRAASKASLHAL
jgi:hypothetical protein